MATNVINNSIENVGGSLAVENVQELASRNLRDIPDRYIRPEIKLDEVSIDESSQIPVIDMKKLAIGNLEYQTEMAKLHQACKEWGFFQLTDHGATTTIEKMKDASEDFFKLPFEQKMAYAQLPNSIEGYGQTFVVSEEQKLDWGDMLLLCPLPVSGRNMRFWPNNPTSLRSTMEEYSLELHKVCISLVKFMATNLGVESGEFIDLFQNGSQGIRINYYPPCSQADKVFGITPHSDASGLTLLVQVNEVVGLQINKDGKWVPIYPIPGAIIVNIGDVMEIMSNGEYRSIEHRVVVNFQKERLSIAAFHSPLLETNIGPLQDLVKENGAKYKNIKYEDYMKVNFGKTLDGKTLLDHVKIQD